MDDLTHCTICFEAYGDSEDRVPRLLPCTHTFCSACVKRLIRNSKLVCPQDNQKHRAVKGAVSFPQNRYILRPVKDSLNSIDEFETCERHNRLKTLYCKDVGCNRPVCQLCMLQNHKSHDVEDIVEVIENMRETAAKTVELLSSNLHSSSRKVEADQREMHENIERQIEILRDNLGKNARLFDSKISKIEEQTATVNSISDSISLKSSFQDLKQKLKTLEEIRRTIHKTLKNNINFQSYEIKGHHRQTQFLEERNAIWFSAKVESARTFEIDYQYVRTIQVLSNNTIVVTGKDNAWGYDWDANSDWKWIKPFRQFLSHLRQVNDNRLVKDNRLTQYKALTGEVVFSKVTDAKVVGEATLNGNKCLVTFERRQRKRLEYLDAEQLNSRLDIEVDDLSWRRIVGAPTDQDTNDIPHLPEATQEYLNNYQSDNICFAYEDTTKIFSVNSSNSFVEAYSVKYLWSLWNFEPDGMKSPMKPSGITTNGNGYLFICDTANKCIQIFDTDGTYICAVDCNGKLELGTPVRIAWSKTESALVVAHSVSVYKSKDSREMMEKWFISVLKVQIQPN